MNYQFYRILHLTTILKCKWYKRWNPIKFKLIGIRVGKYSLMMNKIDIRVAPRAHIDIGSHFTVLSGDSLNALCRNTRLCLRAEDNAKIVIGNWTGISGGCVWSSKSIVIGNHVNIGANCQIIDGDIHSLDWRGRRQDTYTPVPYQIAPIIIEDDVWIGANTIILKGVVIGRRSIIGAGSVVTHSIPSDCIAAGNPCKVIRKTIDESK